MTSFELMALIDAFGDARAILRAYRSAWAKRSEDDDEAVLLEELLSARLGHNYTEAGQSGHSLLSDAWKAGLAPHKIRWKVYRHAFGEAVDESIP